jgi:hypothetical protein
MSDVCENSNRAQLKSLLAANAPIPALLVEKLLTSDDREANADAYYCLSERVSRIQPELELWHTAPLVLEFLFGSIVEPREDADLESHVLSSYEAARGLLGLLHVWSQHPDGAEPRRELVERIQQTFLAGSQPVRDCIEMGFLEHALESPALRPLFQSWKDHPEMREAHARALEWGLAQERREG